MTPFVMDIYDVIESSLNAFYHFRESEDQEIIDFFVQRGLDMDYSTALTQFVPLAFCRVMLKGRGVRFSEKYRLVTGDLNEAEEKELKDEPIFLAALEVASSIKSQVDQDYFLGILGRSAEFHSINTLLNSGSRLEDIILPAPSILE